MIIRFSLPYKSEFKGGKFMQKIWLGLFLALVVCGAAAAQDKIQASTNPMPAVTVSEQPFDFSKADKELNNIEKQLSSGKVSSKETSDYLKKLSDIQNAISQARSQYSGDLENIQKKINALGPMPAEGEKEPADIAKQRKEFTAQADTVKSNIAKADLANTKIDEINNLILKIRNQELLNNILAKQSSILHPQEFWDSLVSFAKFLYELATSPASWYQNLSEADKTTVKSNILSVSVAMLLALVLAVYLNLYIKKWFGYRQNIERPDYSQKVRAAGWVLVARGMIPAAVIGAFLLWLKNTEVISSSSFGLFLKNAALYLLYYYLVKAIVRVVFTPRNSKWRIIEVSDDKAISVSRALIFSIAAICIVSFFQSLATEMNYDSEIVYSLKIFANAVKAFCIVLVTLKLLYDNKELSDDELKEDDGQEDKELNLSTSTKVSLAISALITLAFCLSLLGYIRLSEFIINRFIVSAVVIGIYYIIDKLLRVIFHQILRFKFWIRTLKINRRTLVKSEFWFGLLLSPVMWVLAGLTLLAVWGVSVDILLRNVKNFLVGFNFGGVHVSITSILLGIFTFFLALFLFKLLKESFQVGKLSKIDMDEGVRNSVVTSIGFIGFVFSLILGIAVMGGSFSSIAIIAGALSFGAGLGLQNMVSNLVAGLTILFERPIKLGDWVIINGQEGIVKQINMRSTTLEAWSKANVIIPNSDILSSSLINMTYANRMGRAEINVGVDYDSDIELVKKTLLEIAAANPNVLDTPAPSVTFTNLGDSSLDFQLQCYTSNVYNKGGIANDVRGEIIKRFRELNINIPFPQRVIHLLKEEI